jgi:pimeloyl-ACP methyl ester carboxylesterase
MRSLGILGGLVLGVTGLLCAACGGKEGQSRATSAPSHVRSAGPFTVKIGDRSLSGRCQGRPVSGRPTLVLEAGQGNGATELDSVAAALSKLGLVCSYDRAGLAGSDPAAGQPRLLSDLLADLHAFLDSGHIPKPYLLVGHSLGGSMVLLYAQLHPNDVAGVVAMNPGPTYHDWLRRLRPIVTHEELLENEIKPLSGDVPGEPVDTRASDALLTRPFPQHIPYAIMYAEDCGGGADVYCNKVVEQLEAAHRALAALSQEGRFVPVDRAGHEIFATDLDRVMSVVRDVMARSR